MADPRRSTIAGATASAAAVRTPGAQRRHPADDLERARDDLEALTRFVRAGATSQRHFDELEEEARRIAAAILAPFRGPSARPTAAPLFVSGCGLRAGW